MLDFVDWLGSSLGAIVGFCVFTLICFLGCLYTSCIPFIFLIQFAFTDKKKIVGVLPYHLYYKVDFDATIDIRIA